MSDLANYSPSETVYDIQGQAGNPGEESNDFTAPTGDIQDEGGYTEYSQAGIDDPIGEGSTSIPVSALGFQDPVAPGQPLSQSQWADLVPQVEVPKDPVSNALDANVTAMKNSGSLDVSQQDVIDENRGTGTTTI